MYRCAASVQAGADEVWCNDFNPANRTALVYNLCSSLEAKPGKSAVEGAENSDDLQGETRESLGMEG